MPPLIHVLSAFWLGALHALEPGHGKGVMGAYLVLSRGKPLHVVILGLTSALSHTLVVLILAVTAHVAAATLQNNSGEPGAQLKLWLHLVTGILIILIGYRLIPKSHGHLYRHHGHSCSRARHAGAGSLRILDLLLLGLTNGLMPCPGALVTLLLSINTGALGSGLAVIFAFGAGTALALIVVGMLFVKISSLAGRLTNTRTWSRLAAAAGVFVMGVGLYTALKAARGIWAG